MNRITSLLTGTVYLSGPMSGVPKLNAPEFYRVEKILQDLGWKVYNPVRVNEETGMDSDETLRSEFMRRDVELLLKSDAICQLHGWQRSRGAAFEAMVAFELGLGFLNQSGEPIEGTSPLVELQRRADLAWADSEDWQSAFRTTQLPFAIAPEYKEDYRKGEKCPTCGMVKWNHRDE